MNIQALHSQDKPVQTKALFNTQEGKVISLQILKGGLLKEHITAIPALLVCVKGEIVFEDENGKVITLLSGDYINIEPNLKHWVKSNADSNLLLIK
jgi:quercetin dioxygenase-like cupin family protein